MERNEIKDYHELCRLCACYDAIKLPIFSERGKERKLKDKITTCLPFDVSEDDLLPKSLCYRCIYNVENFYDFRRGCIDARIRLENVIQEALKSENGKNAIVEERISNEFHLQSDIVESDGEGDCPNPADFLEACLVTTRDVPGNLNALKGSTNPKVLDYLGLKRSDEHGMPGPSDFQDESSPHSAKAADDENGIFACKICYRQFSSKSSLTIHTKFHQDMSGGLMDYEKEVFSCYVCEKVFSSKGHLALHSKVHIGESNSPTTSSRSSPSRVSKIYRCDLCSKTYSGAKHLWAHVSSSHKGHPALTCGLCQKTFSSITNLEDHKRSKHTKQNLKDEVHISSIVEEDSNSKCAEESLSEMPSNRRKSSKPRKIERDGLDADDSKISESSTSCLPNNSDDDSLLNDNPNPPIIKEEGPVYPCMLCSEFFDEANLLSNHLLECHGYDGPLDINNSGRSDFGEVLAESMMESETVFCCEICVREFSDRGSLWLHILYTHKNAASKACGICLKICENTDSLLRHIESAHPKGNSDSKSEQKRYMCQVCARQHDSRKKLITHAKIHKLVDSSGNPVDPETVVVQNPDFYSDGFMPSQTCDENATSCDICFKIFENESRLMKHKKMVHRDSFGPVSSSVTSGPYNFYFACEICGLSHLSRSERWKHMSTNHAGESSVTCEVPECGKVFPTSSLKNEHAAHHATQGQYPNTCEVCGKMWKTRVEYWKHMMGVHSDFLPFICGVCLKVFCNLSDLVNHVRNTHWPLLGGDICCDICGRPYSKISKMSRHRKVHYVPDNPPEIQALLDYPKVQSESHFLQQASNLVCDLCENSSNEFENIDLLGKHRQEVHNVMPCDLCPKYYGRTSHLWKHVNKIHKGHPEVTCPTCQRTSASRAHLASHVAKHHRSIEQGPVFREPREPTGVHTCEKCSKIFRKESLVKKHIKHCKGPRPTPITIPPPVNGVYQCDRCQKSFAYRNLLYKHFKHTHAFLDCELCDYKVNTRTDLYEHVRSSHAEDPSVKCDKCDMLLRCKADLIRHRKGHNVSIQLHCCKFCAELVTSKYKLRRHLKSIHGNECRFLCALCLTALPNIEDLIGHVQENHRVNLDRKFTCQICAKPCVNKSKLFEHMKYHGTKYSACKICFKIFSSKEELDDHVNNHPSDSTEEEDFEAESTSVKNDSEVPGDDDDIKDKYNSEKHEKMPESDDKLELCKKGEDPEKYEKEGQISLKRMAEDDEDINKLLLGVDEDTGERKAKKARVLLKCYECSGNFYSKISLKKHIKSTHILGLSLRVDYENHRNSFEDSSSVLSDESNLIVNSEKSESSIHRRGTRSISKSKVPRKVYINSESPIDCDICGKTWPAKKHLWQHLIRYHKNECGRVCGVCLRLSPDYFSLSAHIALEHPNNFDDDSSVLVCRVCGKYHNAKTKLLSHASIHVGHEDRVTDVRHHCLICNDVFAEFSSFSDHIRSVHDNDSKLREENVNIPPKNKFVDPPGNLPFHTCEVCSLVFASEIGLTNHKRLHETSDNFKCGQCGEVFQSAENLCTHKLQKHKGTEFVCADCKSNFSTYNQLTEHNKLCKMKLKSLDDNSDDDDEFLLDDDIEELENSYDVNDTIMSSDSDDMLRSEMPDESNLKFVVSTSDYEKSNHSETFLNEPECSDPAFQKNICSLEDEIQNCN